MTKETKMKLKKNTKRKKCVLFKLSQKMIQLKKEKGKGKVKEKNNV